MEWGRGWKKKQYNYPWHVRVGIWKPMCWWELQQLLGIERPNRLSQRSSLPLLFWKWLKWVLRRPQQKGCLTPQCADQRSRSWGRGKISVSGGRRSQGCCWYIHKDDRKEGVGYQHVIWWELVSPAPTSSTFCLFSAAWFQVCAFWQRNEEQVVVAAYL